VEESIDARGLLRPDALHEGARGRGRFAELARVQPRLTDPFGGKLFFVRPVGAAKVTPVDRRHGSGD
jgi:hypothetical protein